jgi:hypothetical protein
MTPLLPLVVPPLTVLLALVSDRRSEPGAREDFGAGPAVVIAAPLVAVPPVAAVVAGAAAIGIGGYMLWRWTRPGLRVDPNAMTWAMASTAVAAGTAATVQSLRKAGLRIDPKCVWILSPAGILKRFIDLIESRAMQDKLVMATMQKSGVQSTLAGAGKTALRKLQVSQMGGSSLAARLPGISWMVEAVYLLVQALMYLKGSPLLDVALEAFEELLEDLMSCWNGVRKFWPYEIGRGLGAFFQLFVRLARWAVGNAFTKGLGAVTVAVLASWLDDYFETQGAPHGVDENGMGGALNWLFWVMDREELPEEIRAETDSRRPAGRLTYTVQAEVPTDFEVKLVSVEVPGLEFELRPPGPMVVDIPQTAWFVYVRREGEPWQRMAKSVPAMMVDADNRPVVYRFAWTAEGVQVIDPSGEVIWADVVIPAGLDAPDALSQSATWRADPGYEFFLQPRTAPGSSKATYAVSSVLGPGEVPAGEYRLVVRLEGELVEVAKGLHLTGGKDYGVTVSPDGQRMTFQQL